MKSIASELVPKIEKKGVCFSALYSWTMPKYQHMGLSQILMQISMQHLLNYYTFTYMYGVSVNPTKIHIDEKINPFIIKKHFVDLPSF